MTVPTLERRRRLPVYQPAYRSPAPLPRGYRAPLGQRPIKLQEIDLYVTMDCNLTCEFCSVRAGEYEHQDLPLERCLKLIDEASQLGLEELHFLGGEPTMRSDLEEMIVAATERGVETRVITNGLALSRERIRDFIKCGLKELMFSVDGMAQNHNRLRCAGGKGWDQTIAAVERAVSEGIRVRVAMTAYQSNYSDVVPLLETVDRLGVQRFSVFLGSPLGRGTRMKSDVIDPHAWRSLQQRVEARAATLRSDLSIVMEQGFSWHDEPPIDRAPLKGRGTGCNTLLDDYDYLIVRSDGNLYQCVFFMTDGAPIGNVREAPLKESLQFALEREEYRSFTEANDKCASCFHATECGTGCRGYAYLLKGDWLRTDPRCSKSEPTSTEMPEYFPVCPILKKNVRSGAYGGSSEQAMKS
jgi:pyrroloquinoline quinone biosynthesis protein E